jgi:hypothetical protein
MVLEAVVAQHSPVRMISCCSVRSQMAMLDVVSRSLADNGLAGGGLRNC